MTDLVYFFIDAIDARFFPDNSQKDVLKQLWEQSKSKTDSNTCQSILQKGTRKGEVCGKSCKTKFCNTHSKTSEESSILNCKVLIKSGKRKGQACDKKCVKDNETCLLHSKETTTTEIKNTTTTSEKKSDTNVPKKKENTNVPEKTMTTTEKTSDTKVPKKKSDTKVPEKKSDTNVPEKKTKEKKMCCIELKYGPNKGQACNKSCSKGSDACPDHQPIKIKRIGEHYIIKGTNVLYNIDKETAWGHIDKDQKINRFKNDEVARVCEQYNIMFST